MNKFLVILTALLLSGCAAKVSQLQTPEKIEYNGKTYKLTASQDLDTDCALCLSCRAGYLGKLAVSN